METTEIKKSKEEKRLEKEEEEEDNGVQIWSWGAGTDGQLGTGNLNDEYCPQPLANFPYSSSSPISFVACGGAHSIALTGSSLAYGGIEENVTNFQTRLFSLIEDRKKHGDGRVLTWGRGTKGQLGHGEMVNCLKPKLVKSFENSTISHVSAGWNHSGFVTDSGKLFMCGDGSFGQLGTGDHKSHGSPTEVFYFVSKHVEKIACGMRHSLVLVRGPQENIIYGFGSARHGQIGLSDYVPHGMRPCSNLPRVVDGFGNPKIVHVCANGDQSAALSADGQLYTWGRGFGGNSSNPSPCIFPSSLSFSQVALGWNHALLLSGGEVYMLGGKHHGLLNISQQAKMEQQPSTSSARCTSDESFLPFRMESIPCIEGEKVVHIAAGAEHSAVVTDKGKITTWGWGEHGQLGLGNTNDQSSPHIVNIEHRGCGSSARVGVFCGSGFTLVVKLVR